MKLSELRKSIKKAINASIKEIKSNLYDIIIMDEFNALLSSGFASMKDVKKIIFEIPFIKRVALYT